MDTTIERNGKITPYGLACGYIEAYDANGRIRDYYLTDADAVRLSFNGSSYDVHTRIEGVTYDGNFPRWIDSEGGRYRADWEQFDTLTEARRAVVRNRRKLAR